MKYRRFFRKFIAMIAALATMLPVFACTPRQQVEATPQPSAVVETSEPNFNPYKGDRSKYVSIYTDERDKACEADIVKFADTFLDPYNGHAKLTDKDSTVWLYTNPSSYETVYENFYDAELRTEFLKKINELIISVPQLTEFEIIAGLAETLALLKEAHSTIAIPSEKRFPLGYTLMFNENGVELYVERTTSFL